MPVMEASASITIPPPGNSASLATTRSALPPGGM
jgi:hypothetical protein